MASFLSELSVLYMYLFSFQFSSIFNFPPVWPQQLAKIFELAIFERGLMDVLIWDRTKIVPVYIDHTERPLVTIVFSSSLGAFCYMVTLKPSQRQETGSLELNVRCVWFREYLYLGFDLSVPLSSPPGVEVQWSDPDELLHRSQVGVIGSWNGFGFNCLALIV